MAAMGRYWESLIAAMAAPTEHFRSRSAARQRGTAYSGGMRSISPSISSIAMTMASSRPSLAG